MNMSHGKIYTMNESRAVSETLDGETIIINLETGSYYSMNETGSIVWNQILLQHSVDQIIQFFLDHYDASFDVVEKSIACLIESLENDNLIIEAGDISNAPLGKNNSPKKTFVAPVIEKYTDMQEMLLADPIHDVDAVGWPKLKGNA